VPTDTASRTIEVDAPYDRVLETIRDVASQPDWVPEIREAVVQEKNPDGTPATARFTAATPVGTDEYVLTYEHHRDGMSWSLVEGRMQTGQDARYTLRRLEPGRTAVTFELAISHNLPLPGFLRRKVLNGLVTGTVTGLKRHLES
jgi:uncharacterized membrane protein